MAISLSASASFGFGGKQFLARIKGRDPKFTFAREFIGRKGGKRDEGTSALVDSPGLYQKRDIKRKGAPDDSFTIVYRDLHGELQRTAWIGEEDAMPLATLLESGASADAILAADYKRRLKEHLAEEPEEDLKTSFGYGAFPAGTHKRREFTDALRSEIARLGGERPAADTTPSWGEILAGIAQGAINITEGLTTIERGSQVHSAMLALCEKWSAIENGKAKLPKAWQANSAHLAGYEETA